QTWHRAGQRHRSDRRGLPGAVDDQRVESRSRGFYDSTRGPHRPARRAADRAGDAAGGGRIRSEYAWSRWLRPHRRALTALATTGNDDDREEDPCSRAGAVAAPAGRPGAGAVGGVVRLERMAAVARQQS